MLSFAFKSGTAILKPKFNEAERLEGENHLLRIEIGKLRALIDQQTQLEQLLEEAQNPSLSLRRCDETKFLLGIGTQAVPARVIYRDPGSWSSSLWVNVGEETNTLLKRQIVQKNSPVLVGRSVVGAIDYVGRKQSRVRLITDVALKPSVRAVRGLPQNAALLEHLEPLLRHVHGRGDLVLTPEERAYLVQLLEKVKRNLSENAEGWYLAKGILQGSGAPLWRSVNKTLRGIGFNYDFADEEGPARELATGKPLSASSEAFSTIPIIQVNDLLVTTGLDGVFPPGLRVGEVTKIYPLREGAYTYEIEASPVVGNLDSLQTVFIIPPLGYDEEDQKER